MKTVITTIASLILTLTVTAQKVYPITGTVTMTQPTCNGYSNGELSITPNNGLPPYTYLWSTGDTTQTISDLSAGNYSVVVNDAMGQTMGGFFTLTNPSPILIEGLVTKATFGQNNGAIDVTNIVGTAGAYDWIWTSNNGQTFNQTTLDQSNLMPGNYKLVVTDQNGCQGFGLFTVGQILKPLNNPGFTIPGTNSNTSALMQNEDAENNNTTRSIRTEISSNIVLDLTGKEVNLEYAPSGFYLVVENGIVTQKIYKN